MDSTQARTEQVRSGYLNSNAMSAGLTLLAVGGVVGASGMAISGTAMMRSFRRWLTAQQQQPLMEQPAREQPVRPLARNKMIPARPTPAKTTPAKTATAKTAPALSNGPKDMATPSVAR